MEQVEIVQSSEKLSFESMIIIKCAAILKECHDNPPALLIVHQGPIIAGHFKAIRFTKRAAVNGEFFSSMDNLNYHVSGDPAHFWHRCWCLYCTPLCTAFQSSQASSSWRTLSQQGPKPKLEAWKVCCAEPDSVKWRLFVLFRGAQKATSRPSTWHWQERCIGEEAENIRPSCQPRR